MKNKNTIHFKEVCNIIYVKKAHKSVNSGCYSYFIVFVYKQRVFKAYYKLDIFLAHRLIKDNNELMSKCFIDWYYNTDTKKVNIIDIKD